MASEQNETEEIEEMTIVSVVKTNVSQVITDISGNVY